MTKVQLIYKKTLPILRPLHEKKLAGTITWEENEKLEYGEKGLWKYIQNYAADTLHHMMNGRGLSTDAVNEVMSEMRLAWFEKLYLYDPDKAAPTTYFVNFFKQAITKYMEKDRWHINAYDVSNYGRILRAKNECLAKGNPNPDITLLSTMTGLSPKVIKGALYHGTNSARANIDDCLTLRSRADGPEEYMLKKESSKTLADAVSELDEPERSVIYLRVNGDDGKGMMPYEQIAERLDLPIKTVKSAYNHGIRRLAKSENIKKLYYELSEKKENYVLQDCSASIQEKNFEDYFFDISFGNPNK